MEELLGAMRGSLEAHVCCGMWGEHGTRQCGTSSQIPNLQQSSLNYLLLLELVQPFTFFFFSSYLSQCLEYGGHCIPPQRSFVSQDLENVCSAQPSSDVILFICVHVKLAAWGISGLA